MGKTKVGIVSYLNARPLVYPFITGEVSSQEMEFIFDTPANLAAQLRKGEIDIGLIPSIEYAYLQDCLVVPGIAIACHGPVKSILLYTKGGSDKMRVVALDETSKTSAALVRILLAARYGLQPEYLRYSPQLEAMLDEADAALLIGDQALTTSANGHAVLDLGEEWLRWTGLDFVFAFFVVRKEAEYKEAVRKLIEAGKIGTKQLGEIARKEASGLGLSERLCYRYLRDNLRYDLNTKAIQGLQKFYSLAWQANLIPQEVNLKFCH